MELDFPTVSLSRFELLTAIALLVGMVIGLLLLLPGPLLVLGGAIVFLTAVTYATALFIAIYSESLPSWTRALPIWLTLLLPFAITTLVIFAFDVRFSLVNGLLLISLVLVFFYYWLVVPLALYQRIREQSRSVSITQWPSLTVLVPAYNEAGYVGRCIDSFLEADYPWERLEVVVIDDGSSDDTYVEACQHATGPVTVLQKENGGKHSALNFGLDHATTELIVTVDADSIVEPDALKELVRTMQANPDAGAVAGNVRVSNRGSMVTNLQALEYIIGINTFRRAFDLLGVVTVVPGCLGLFKRDVVERVGQYPADTLTEDFDLTIQLLKEGVRIYHSNAIVNTEGPDTWSDLYKQRLRWFRGNLQTVSKHRHMFTDADFGLLHRVASPYFFFSMGVIPPLGLLILVVIAWQAVMGAITEFLGLLALFLLLQFLLCILAIRIEGEDLWLARYAPLTIVGYKQYLDAVLVKSLADIFRSTNLTWTSPERVRQRDTSPEEDG